MTAPAGSTWVETSKTLLQNDKFVALQTVLAATTELFFFFGQQLLPHQENLQKLLENKNTPEEDAARSSVQGDRRAQSCVGSDNPTRPGMKAWNGANTPR